MVKQTITGTITLDNVPVTLEVDLPAPGPEPSSRSWAYQILGTSQPARGLNGPQLTLDAQQRRFDDLCDPSLPERTDLQAQIDAASSVCILEPGVYRCSAVVNRPVEIRGHQQVSIRASDVWTDWTQSAGAWTSSLSVPDWPPEPLESFEATDIWRASRPWIVMVDGVRFFIEPGTGTPSEKHFRLDEQSRVILPIDPRDSLVEVTTRGGAGAWLNVQADDVILEGLDFRHAPSGLARWNPLESNTRRISYVNSMFGWCHGYGPAPGGSTASFSQSCVYHNSGIGGLGSPSMVDLEFRDGVLFNNGFGEGWARENASGGFKDISSKNTLFENNACFNNGFSGLWVDIDAQGSRFRSNALWDNGGNQLHYEISQGGLIEDNVCFRTPHFKAPDLTERTLGFYVSSSRLVMLRRNLSLHLPSMFEIRWTERDDAPAAGCNHITVQDNVAIGRPFPEDQVEQWGADFGLVWVDSAGGTLMSDPSNVARNNRYGYPAPEPENRWSYLDTWLDTLAALQATPQIGQGASYLSDADRLAYLSRFGLSES